MSKKQKRKLIRLAVRATILTAIVITLVCQSVAIHNLQAETKALASRGEASETCPEPEPAPTEPELISLGEFVLTAYCPCEKCCGYWATIRPEDENGEPIVYTATGARAKPNHTIAVDPDVIPYGTVVIINGQEYVAEDCGGAIDSKRIDVYFENHQEALEFGRQTATVYVWGGE